MPGATPAPHPRSAAHDDTRSAAHDDTRSAAHDDTRSAAPRTGVGYR